MVTDAFAQQEFEKRSHSGQFAAHADGGEAFGMQMPEPLADREQVDLFHRDSFFDGEVLEKLVEVRSVVSQECARKRWRAQLTKE